MSGENSTKGKGAAITFLCIWICLFLVAAVMSFPWGEVHDISVLGGSSLGRYPHGYYELPSGSYEILGYIDEMHINDSTYVYTHVYRYYAVVVNDEFVMAVRVEKKDPQISNLDAIYLYGMVSDLRPETVDKLYESCVGLGYDVYEMCLNDNDETEAGGVWSSVLFLVLAVLGFACLCYIICSSSSRKT